MILVASRGEAFEEPFNFKNEQGQLMNVPAGSYTLHLERGDFVKEFTNLTRRSNAVLWHMTADETKALPFSAFSFELAYNGQPIASGVLRVK
jgi:hypothetical protein